VVNANQTSAVHSPPSLHSFGGEHLLPSIDYCKANYRLLELLLTGAHVTQDRTTTDCQFQHRSRKDSRHWNICC